MIALVSCVVLATVLQDALVTPEPSQQWTRRTEGENKVSLEIVSRKYEAEGKPDLWLIGVAHIADTSFYEDVNALLDTMGVVLYESVRPTGSRQPSGNTEEEKVESTQKSLEFISDVAKRGAEESNTIPKKFEEVVKDAALLDKRLSSWVEGASVDAWGKPISFQVDFETSTISFTSFGSDSVTGGEGYAADLTVSCVLNITTGETAEEETVEQNMQQELAVVLGLEFQLESLSYEDPTWFCSDLTMGEVEAKLAERGVDSAVLGMITGDSFVAKIATGMMKIIPLLDSLTGGGIRETARLLMIEILSMPESDQMLEGLEPELAQVIIVDRNTEVLGDIAGMLESTEAVSSIGVLYGAGHMPDMAQRLDTLFGYVPVEDRWFTSMSANPKNSILGESEIKRMRFMLRYQMHKAKEAKEQAEKKLHEEGKSKGKSKDKTKDKTE